MQTSFKKKPRGTNTSFTINGTRPSLHNGQLLCSTGVPSLDAVIGGGIPVGSVFLLAEDVHNQYSHLLTRYYLAEGVMSSHSLFLVEAGSESALMHHLPQPILLEEDEESSSANDMKIAWRYQNSPQIQTSMGHHSNYGHYYNVAKTMDEKYLENSKTEFVDITKAVCGDIPGQNLFKNVLRELSRYISEKNFDVQSAIKSKQQMNVLRIGIPSFCSPFWGCADRNRLNIYEVVRFLNCLRTIVRDSLAVCWVTIPTHLYPPSNVEIIRHNVDMVVGLESFSGSKTNPLYKEYHGLLTIQKLPVLNSLLPYTPDSYDLAFKLKRKKFTVERLHLPPDIGETASRQGVEETESRLFCGSGNEKSPIDF